MKKVLILVLTFSFILSTAVFAKQYKIMDKTIKVQDENKIVREVPTQYSYDKTCYIANNIDGVIVCKYSNTYSKGWKEISLEDYIKRYDERNNLEVSY